MAFGDDDPEDAWDEGDSLTVKVALLHRIVDHIEDEGTAVARFHPRRANALRLCVIVLVAAVFLQDTAMAQTALHLIGRLAAM
jgi:hypothetical protein